MDPTGATARDRPIGREAKNGVLPAAKVAGGRPPDPSTKHSTCRREVNGEGTVFARSGSTGVEGGSAWRLYCLCDGRAGSAASDYVRAHLWTALRPLLPDGRLPDTDTEDFTQFARDTRSAVIEAFKNIQEGYTAECTVGASGSSVTLALLRGWLLTVANVGDADAVLDTGTDVILATLNHSLETNDAERRRLARAGVRVTRLAECLTRPAGEAEGGVGPLRCWPGGLKAARSVGDVAAGEHVLPYPHIFQVDLPKSGARLLMGSRGLWDLIHWEDAAKSVRRTPAQGTASRVIALAMLENNWSTSKDITALAVDILPPDGESFPKAVKAKLRREDLKRGRELHSCRNRVCQWIGCKIATQTDSIWKGDDCQVVANVDGWLAMRAAQEGRASAERRRSAGYTYPERRRHGHRLSSGRRSAESRRPLPSSALYFASEAPERRESGSDGRVLHSAMRRYCPEVCFDLAERPSLEVEAVCNHGHAGSWGQPAQRRGHSQELDRRRSEEQARERWMSKQRHSVVHVGALYPYRDVFRENLSPAVAGTVGMSSGQRVGFTMTPCWSNVHEEAS